MLNLPVSARSFANTLLVACALTIYITLWVNGGCFFALASAFFLASEPTVNNSVSNLPKPLIISLTRAFVLMIVNPLTLSKGFLNSLSLVNAYLRTDE